MNNSQKAIQQIVAFDSSTPYSTNVPSQYGTRNKQYMADRTKAYIANRAYLSTDFVDAQVQGTTDVFENYISTQIRLADISAVTATSTKKSDDVKEVLFVDEAIDYVPIGAKIITMGNTWIVTNPSNMSNVGSTCVASRCNASYNSYDEYGNIITEPIVVMNREMHGNNNVTPDNLVLMDGNFNIICQLNENTKKLGINKRIILGSKPYHITGFTDFIQEFTGDRNSVHLMSFTVRLEEPSEYDDIDEAFIANGKTYSFEAEISGQRSIPIGITTQLTANFIVNGDIAQSTAVFPLDWEWASSNEAVITVDENGNATAVAEGNASVIAILRQNSKITATFDISVTPANANGYVAFLEPTATYIGQYTTETFYAAYFDGNGNETEYPLSWEISGARPQDYNAVYALDGKSVTVFCQSSSDTPLQIRAKYGEFTATAQAELRGY